MLQRPFLSRARHREARTHEIRGPLRVSLEWSYAYMWRALRQPIKMARGVGRHLE